MKMKTEEERQEEAIEQLRVALDGQRAYLSSYAKPRELFVYETIRALDDLFCRDLMEPDRLVDEDERHFRAISTWGVNQSLKRVFPRILSTGRFQNFESREEYQDKADDFVFGCGVLELSERYEGWLKEDILSGRVRIFQRRGKKSTVLELRGNSPSYSDEEIGLAGLRWVGEQTWTQDRGVELRLEERHKMMEPELERRVELVDGWRVNYSSTQQIDDYFLEWANLYLRRIFSQDMIAGEEVIGGRPFSRYLEVLSVLSAYSQKHIAFAAILRARHASVHIRNLLTTHCSRQAFIENLGSHFDADRLEIGDILNSFILSVDNLEAHTSSGETAWAPIVQASSDTLIHPIYGLDINPFLFLLTDLRFRYEKDWFRIANNREKRWITELKELFNEPRWHTHDRNLRLREGGRDLTDIDFVVYEAGANELALFQLKWQHPVGMDNRGRRSAGRNLIVESNRWIVAVSLWLEQHGVAELMQRLNLRNSSVPTVYLFVLGRYHVHLSGFDTRDDRAIWADWAHFRRARAETGETATVRQIASTLQSFVGQSRAMKGGESMMFPVGNIAVVLNPTSVPDRLGLARKS